MSESHRRVTISLPSDLVERIDRFAEVSASSRSNVVRQALRRHLAALERWEHIFLYGEEAARRVGATDESVRRAVAEGRKRD